MQLFEYQQTDYVAIAATFTQELAATAIEIR